MIRHILAGLALIFVLAALGICLIARLSIDALRRGLDEAERGE